MVEEPIAVLVVEDDPDAAAFVRTVLSRRGMVPTLAGSADEALAAFTGTTFDVVITDINLPGMTGLELLSRFRSHSPGIPVVVMTAFASVDQAVDALRRSADEFLVKPVPAETLVERVLDLARRYRSRREAPQDHARVLAVGAHPDDVEIGVGATLGAHRAAGDEVTILTLSGGEVGGSSSDRQLESAASAGVIGADLVLESYQDTRLGHAEGVIDAIERVVRSVDPTIVYTHSQHDRHQDHRAVHDAVDVAARKVPAVACYQSPSCTVDFHPARFVPVDDHLETKLAMLAAFRSQSHRDYMQPDVVRATARYWSRFGSTLYVEPLEIVRATTMLSASPGHFTEAQTREHVEIPEHTADSSTAGSR